MRIRFLAVLVTCLAAGPASAQYHDTRYLFGGYGSTNPQIAEGPWIADAGQQTFTRIGPKAAIWYYSYGMTTDVDNRKVVCSTNGNAAASYHMQAGVFRVDPTAGTVTTVFHDANLIHGITGPVHVNQDGDYVFTAYSRVNVGTASSYHYRLYKVPSLGGSITTLFTSQRLLTGYTTCHQGGQADIHTGDYVLQVSNLGLGLNHAILNLSLDGATLSTWSTGGSHGLDSWAYDGLIQDWDTGHWMNVYGSNLYRLEPGTTSRTTILKLSHPSALRIWYAGKLDLRSAPRKLVRIGGQIWNTSPQLYLEPCVVTVDLSGPPYAVTYVSVDPQKKTARTNNDPVSFNFYRGRHVQTLEIAPKRWQLRISCPRFAGKTYLAAISVSGFKPAIPLPDGRRIYLRPDSLTQPAMSGWLRPIFDPGPGTLDARGEAVGGLNFAALPSLGIPLWIAVIVLDPQAPGGIAYIPDTFVFRTP